MKRDPNYFQSYDSNHMTKFLYLDLHLMDFYFFPFIHLGKKWQNHFNKRKNVMEYPKTKESNNIFNNYANSTSCYKIIYSEHKKHYKRWVWKIDPKEEVYILMVPLDLKKKRNDFLLQQCIHCSRPIIVSKKSEQRGYVLMTSSKLIKISFLTMYF